MSYVNAWYPDRPGPRVSPTRPGTPPGTLPMLTAAVLMATASQERPTMRSVAEACGGISPSTALWHLSDLRELGLVTWVDGQRGTLKATVRWFSPYADTATTGN